MPIQPVTCLLRKSPSGAYRRSSDIRYSSHLLWNPGRNFRPGLEMASSIPLIASIATNFAAGRIPRDWTGTREKWAVGRLPQISRRAGSARALLKHPRHGFELPRRATTEPPVVQSGGDPARSCVPCAAANADYSAASRCVSVRPQDSLYGGVRALTRSLFSND